MKHDVALGGRGEFHVYVWSLVIVEVINICYLTIAAELRV